MLDRSLNFLARIFLAPNFFLSSFPFERRARRSRSSDATFAMADAAHDNAHAVLGKDNVDVDLKAVRHVVIIGSGPREVAREQAGVCGARGPAS